MLDAAGQQPAGSSPSDQPADRVAHGGTRRTLSAVQLRLVARHFGGIYLCICDGRLPPPDRRRQHPRPGRERSGSWVMASQADFNLDVHKEVALASERLIALVAPDRGGQLYELTFAKSATTCWPRSRRDRNPITPSWLRGPTRPPWPSRSIAVSRAWPSNCTTTSIRAKSLIDHFYEHHVHLDQFRRRGPRVG